MSYLPKPFGTWIAILLQ